MTQTGLRITADELGKPVVLNADGSILTKKEWKEIKAVVQSFFKPEPAAAAIVERPPQYNPEDVRLTDLLHDLVSRNFPFIAAKPFDEKDYEEMNRIARLDGKPYILIEKMIEWCQQDEFWKQNIRSVQKLRKQFDQMLIRAKAEHDKKARPMEASV